MAAEEVQLIIKSALAEGRRNLLEPEAKAICLSYGIPTPRFKVAASVAEAVTYAEELGYPVVLKVVSPDIIHKTEAGGVIIGLTSGADVQRAYTRMTESVRNKRPNARVTGIIVQKMAPDSTEVIVGSINDQQFGQTVLFGLGGVFVEILKDVTFRVAPLEERDAREMIHEIKGYHALAGYRGYPPADQDAIVNLILSASRLVTENPQIDQMDLNPTIVYERGAFVVDARILVSNQRSPKASQI